jgi:hypothetical protein
MDNTEDILNACLFYRHDHANRAPESLLDLAGNGYLEATSLQNPRWPDVEPGYVYLPEPGRVYPTQEWEKMAIVVEHYRRWPRKGVVVGYGDWRVLRAGKESDLALMLADGEQ